MVSANLLESRTDMVRTQVMSNYDLSFKDTTLDRKIKLLALGGDALYTIHTEKVKEGAG